MNKVEKYKLDIFIKGENIDLCLPSLNFAQNSSWYNWFNNFGITRFLEQGLFPNTRENQVEFYNSLQTSNDRVSLIICDRKSYIGTISLSYINPIKKTADIALLIGENSNEQNNDLFALEAMSLMTQFAFEKLGLIRISAGQHEMLKKWQSKLEIIGYRVEGYLKYGFIKGPEIANAVKISIIKEDYQMIIKNRNQLWDNTEFMRVRINKMPEELFVDKLKGFLEKEGEKYYRQIFES